MKMFSITFISHYHYFISGIVGTSISFTFTFALLDAINFCVSSGGSGKPLIESPQQIYLILGVSVFLGAIFGFIFGCMDVEDFISVEELRGNLMKEERICLPIGALTGGKSFLRSKIYINFYFFMIS